MYWDTGPSGHIALAVGDGTVLSNDIRVPGRIDRVPQQEINKWGPYRGWWSPNGLKGTGKSFTSTIEGGGILDPIGMLAGLIAGPLKKISGVPGGAWGDLIGGLPKMISRGMTSKVKEVFHFDNGGYLQPGYTLAYNGLSSPEPIFTPQQWSKINAGGGGGDVEVRVYLGDRELTDIVHTEIRRSTRDLPRLARQGSRTPS